MAFFDVKHSRVVFFYLVLHGLRSFVQRVGNTVDDADIREVLN